MQVPPLHANGGQTERHSYRTETALLSARSCRCKHKSKDKNVSCCVKLLQGEDPGTLSSMKLSISFALLEAERDFRDGLHTRIGNPGALLDDIIKNVILLRVRHNICA